MDGGRRGVDCVGCKICAEVEALSNVVLDRSYSIFEEGEVGRTKINTNGFEAMKRCGRSNNSLALCFKLSPKVFLPLAFSIIPLSIIVMIGATRAPAAPADSASTPTRNPSFDVFHSRFAITGELSMTGFAFELELPLGSGGNGSLGFGTAAGIGVLKPGTAGASASATPESVLGRYPSFAGAFKALLFSPIATFSGD